MSIKAPTSEEVRAMRINRARDTISRATRYASLRPQAEASAYINSLAATARALIEEVQRSPLPTEPAKGEPT